MKNGNGQINLGSEEEEDHDVVPEESDPEIIHARIITSRKNREKFAIKKSYSIEVCHNFSRRVMPKQESHTYISFPEKVEIAKQLNNYSSAIK